MQSYCLDSQSRIIKADGFTPSEFRNRTAKNRETLASASLNKVSGLNDTYTWQK